MKKRIVSLFAALALCLGLLPTTALAAAPSGQVIYVGNVNVTSGGYWTTGNDGTVTKFTGEGTPANNFIHYDATNNVLTLHNAVIKKGLDYSESIQGGTYIHGSAIGVFNQSGNAELTIALEGTNTIAEISMGIYVLSSSDSTGNASLTITGSGSLDASGSQTGIQVQSNSGGATLSIENAKVTTTGSFFNGVMVQAKDSSNASLTVNGGSLTATGSGESFGGIQLQFGSSTSSSGTPTVTVSNNAIVRANGGIANNASSSIEFGTGNKETGGIVFDGKNGTVYGNVTLQEDLEIGEGESLKLDDGAKLNAGGHNVIVDGGTVDDSIKTNLGNSVKYPPTITTASPLNGTVNEEYSQTLAATGSDPITWSVSNGSLPDGLSLNESTGLISGTPTAAGTYAFTVQAQNTYGTATKEWTIEIKTAPTYTVSVEPDEVRFPSVTEGYEPQEPKKITITNNGNQKILLEDYGKDPWLDITLDTNTLDPNEKAIVTIKLKDDLGAVTQSTLKAFITYTSEDGESFRDRARFEVSYEVKHDMKRIAAKAATHLEEGNIEYWYCEYCRKCYKNSTGTTELSAEDITLPKLQEHTATGTWYHDETNHWNTCECGAKLNEAAHTFRWVIDKEATAAEAGAKHEECTACGYARAAVAIPATGQPASPAPVVTPSPAPAATPAPAIPQTGDADPVALWAALAAVSAAALLGLALLGRALHAEKRRKN